MVSRVLLLSIFLAITIPSSVSALDFESTIAKCCESGQNSQSDSCEPTRAQIESSLINSARSLYDACFMAYRLCCAEERSSQECEKAQNEAMNGAINGYSNTVGGNCHIACHLGMQTGKSTGRCNLKGSNFGIPWTKSWMECCLTAIGKSNKCDIYVSCDGQKQAPPDYPPPTYPPYHNVTQHKTIVSVIPNPYRNPSGPCLNDTINCQGITLVNEDICVDQCGPFATCVPLPDSKWRCDPYCESGLKLAPDGSCVDVDECLLGIHFCGADATCINVYRSYRCQCRVGYRHESGRCVDINECESKDVCVHNECHNTPGSFICICQSGYMSKDGQCIDIDECKSNPCPNEECFNLPGSYRCGCREGFTRVGRVCEDINECHYNPSVCEYRCQNQIGYYTCLCPPGFQLSQDGRTCEDIDECKRGDCGHQACMNVKGSYMCSSLPNCPPGYIITPEKKCISSDGITEIFVENVFLWAMVDLPNGAFHVYQQDAEDCSPEMVDCKFRLTKSPPSVYKTHFELRRSYNAIRKTVSCSVYMIKTLQANTDVALQLNTTIFRPYIKALGKSTLSTTLLPLRAYVKDINIHVAKNPFAENPGIL